MYGGLKENVKDEHGNQLKFTNIRTENTRDVIILSWSAERLTKDSKTDKKTLVITKINFEIRNIRQIRKQSRK